MRMGRGARSALGAGMATGDGGGVVGWSAQQVMGIIQRRANALDGKFYCTGVHRKPHHRQTAHRDTRGQCQRQSRTKYQIASEVVCAYSSARVALRQAKLPSIIISSFASISDVKSTVRRDLHLQCPLQ